MPISRLALLLLLAPALAAALPPHEPRPGGVAVLPLGAQATQPTVRFNGKPVLVTRQAAAPRDGAPLDGDPAIKRPDGRNGSPSSAFRSIPSWVRRW